MKQKDVTLNFSLALVRLVNNMPQCGFIRDFISISMEAGDSKLLTYTKVEMIVSIDVIIFIFLCNV